jgi:hypothetical protein
MGVPCGTILAFSAVSCSYTLAQVVSSTRNSRVCCVLNDAEQGLEIHVVDAVFDLYNHGLLEPA